MDNKRLNKILKSVKEDPDNIKKDLPIKHTTEKNKPTSNRFEFYTCCYTFQLKPITKETLDHLAEKLLKWARDNDEALKLSQFYHREGVDGTDFYAWCEKNENLKRAHKNALEMIGNRREILGLKKKFDSGLVSTTMPLYDKSWREVHEWKAKLKAENDTNNGVQIVVMKDVPNSDLVPVKKIKENV